MHRLPFTAAATVLVLLFSPSIVSAQEMTASALDSLAGRGSLLFRKSDGSFVQGKVMETTADSLILGTGKKRHAVARSDVEQVWRKEKTILHSAILGAGLGAVGGAFLELSLGSCEECGQTGDVLAAAGLGALGRAIEGALVGWLGGNWAPLDPPAAALPADRRHPWEPWGASLRVGAAHRYNVGAEPNSFAGGFTGWKNSRPGSSWGFEYGTLSRISDHSSYSFSYADSFFGRRYAYHREADTQDNWAFSGLSWRNRGAGPGLHGFVTSGFGGYLRRGIVESVTYDSLTAQTSYHSGSSTDLRSGISLGGGIATGSGDWKPAVEVRGHWAFSEETLWLTVQAGVDFH